MLEIGLLQIRCVTAISNYLQLYKVKSKINSCMSITHLTGNKCISILFAAYPKCTETFNSGLLLIQWFILVR